MDEIKEVNGEKFVDTEYNEAFVEVLESIRNQLVDFEGLLKSKLSNSEVPSYEEYARSIRIYVEQQILGYKTLYESNDNSLKR